MQRYAVNTYGGVDVQRQYCCCSLAQPVSRRSLAAKVVVGTSRGEFEFVVGQVTLGHVSLPLLLYYTLVSLHYFCILIHLILTNAA